VLFRSVKLKTSCIKRIRQDLKATPYLGKMALNKMTSEEIILSSGDSNQKSKKGLSNVGAELENDLKFDRKKCENRKGAFILKDYSQMPPANGNTAGISNMIVQKLPVKLVAILNDQASQDIVSWLPHGRAWKIQNTYLFVNQVLPNYFEKPNYNSFIRLTNAWGFRRITRGVDKDAYYHELFLRGLPHLHSRMRRLTPNDTKTPVAPEDEPDFNKMGEVRPFPSDLSRTPLRTDVPPSLLPQPQQGSGNIDVPLLRQQGLLGYSTDPTSQLSNLLGIAPSSGPLPFNLSVRQFPGILGFPMNSVGGYLDDGVLRSVATTSRENQTDYSPTLGHFNSIERRNVELALNLQEIHLQIEHLRERERRYDLASSLAPPDHGLSTRFEMPGLLSSAPGLSIPGYSSAMQILREYDAQMREAIIMQGRRRAAHNMVRTVHKANLDGDKTKYKMPRKY